MYSQQFKIKPPQKAFNTQRQYNLLKVHFCIYRIHYYAKRVCDSLFTRVDSLLDEMPQRSLENFADAFRRLISGIENLRFSYLRDAKLKCHDKYCRWREIDISDDKPIEMCCGHSGFGIRGSFFCSKNLVSRILKRFPQLFKGFVHSF